MNRMVVSRWGSLCALGAGEQAFAALMNGQSAIHASDRWGVPVAPITSPVVEGPRTTALALTSLAGLQVSGRGLGVVFATTTAGMLESEPSIAAWARGQDHVADDLLWRHLAHHPALAIQRAFGATGPVLTVSTACSSGTTAIGVATELIAAGRCERVLVVGSDALCMTTVGGFRSLGACTQTLCRPMSAERDGMALGEAAAWLLIEPAGPGPRVEIVGVATNSDGLNLTAPDPEGQGLRRAILQALGGVPGDQLDHVNAHATGTEANDGAEAASIAASAPNAAVSATKGATGHTLGAAGVLEAVFTVQCLLAGVVPPTCNLGRRLAIDVAPHARERKQRLAASVNLAFGGHNAAVVFERVPS